MNIVRTASGLATEAGDRRQEAGDRPILLEVEGLTTVFSLGDQEAAAVRGVSFVIRAGETLALVGESGSGKSVTALSFLGLVPPPGRITGGSIIWNGHDLTTLEATRLHRIRGREIALVLQDPSAALNPVFTVGDQIIETLLAHRIVPKSEARAWLFELLDAVRIPDGDQRADEYPHQLSGGLRQRVMIALGLAGDPKLLIADEPTTGLDATTQSQIVDLLRDLVEYHDLALLLISHDLAVVDACADRVAVMYAGQIIEEGPARAVLRNPGHPYTPGSPGIGARHRTRHHAVRHRGDAATAGRATSRLCLRASVSRAVRPVRDAHAGLVGVRQRRCRPVSLSFARSSPALGGGHRRLAMPLLEVDGLVKRFVRRRLLRSPVVIHAVNDVSFTVNTGESFGLVGESGSGKTTAARCILRLVTPTAGEIRFDGTPIGSMSRQQLRRLRRSVQPVFQDPYASLNPRLPVGDSVAEPLVVHRIGTAGSRRDRVKALLNQVGLDPSLVRRRPGELSGGQRQRIALARARALDPQLVVLDEPVSALDASVGAQIVNLLMRLQCDLALGLLFITHDLRLVRHMTTRVAVMRTGRIVETAATAALFAAPQHPYTQRLLAATDLSSRLPHDPGEPPPDPDTPLREVVAGHWARI